MITDPLFYLCAIPAVLIFGMAKGGFGGGIAVISVPLMSLVISPVQAATILLPLLVAMDMVALWSFRGSWSKRNIKLTLPGAIAGIVIGAFTFRYLSEDAIRILVGVIVVLFCLDYWFRPASPGGSKPSLVKGTFWGTISGFTSFGIHSGGAPMSVYLLPQQMEKKLLMGTFAVFFTVVNLVKLIPYTWLGQFDHTNLMTSLVLLPLAPVGVRLGYYLLHKIDETTVYRLCYFFLFVVGVKLLWDGVSGAL
ncbi:sulfite exporter TauE/SafE family protein [Pseudomaricurvus alcaniphilus]|uniref:sulfite exporter TauE/SafE family protein n=1 Tax=Pseudomaricurvus alcaniphilus TaxID=1166482 RepID=UPI001407B5B2|nr:sulfite exporter TauE/SafE family protein [Pseudomaricurvus alcaniphilus]NHN39605.1 sulfite exporter TauE/SafE family protein [Pseudomaricurvus alcaniphilus]